jgi:glyoxylase-like metal-dependent hydrolase (beta-lactamase superfamily II)
MPLRIERYGDVQRIRMWSAGSRAAGLDVSAYVVRGVLIDSGFPHVRRALLSAVRELRVSGVAVTHWHEDHAGNIASLAALGLPVFMRSETVSTLRDRPKIALYRHVIWGRPPLLVLPLIPFSPAGIRGIHTPGHSRDHQVIWDDETATVFSGDLWLGVHSRAVHASEDPYAIVESLRRVRALGPERMFDAHRGLVATPVAAIEAKIDWLGATLSDIERRIASGWTDREIVRHVLGGEERSGILSGGDYARRNLVRAARIRRGGD